MQIQLDNELMDELDEIARKQQRDRNELVHSVLRQYVEHETDREKFRGRVQRHIQEHEWLLNELAKRPSKP